MQVKNRTIRQMKVQLKQYFPREYALVMAEKLRQKGVSPSIQQIYNFFNNIPVKNRTEIFHAATELIKEEQERRTQVAEIRKELNINL